MGLDAFVRCRCWQDGLAAPFPNTHQVIVGDDGGLELDVPCDDAHKQVYDALDNWLNTGCPHRGMKLAREWISNWFGVSDFRAALIELGADRFPALLESIPSTNGGQTNSREAARCMAELERFSGVGAFGRAGWVLDAETRERIQQGLRNGEPF